MSTEIISKRTEFDTGEIFRKHGQAYERKNRMPSEQRKVLRAIASCRTEVLGGHLDECNSCGHQQPSYNSCRNANCPKCQGNKRQKWVDSRLEELLPGAYFHCVFTLPDAFNSLHVSHYKIFYNALFRASSKTLLCFFKELGGEPSMVAILHTWGQSMCLHPHIHYLVSGGCLSFDRKRWIRTSSEFLFDVKEMSQAFKKMFLEEIDNLIPEFDIPEATRKKDWVVHCTKPFAGAEKVVNYLGRYTYRTSLSNRRIKNFTDGKVTIDFKDYADLDKDGIPKHKPMELLADEFIRRFLQHVPKSRFRRIRSYGILAGKDRAEKLKIAQDLLGPIEEDLDDDEFERTVSDHSVCSQCEKGVMIEVKSLPAIGPPPIVYLNEIKRKKYAYA